MQARSRTLVVFALAGVSLLVTRRDRKPWHSPYEVAFSRDGTLIAASDRTAASVWLVDAAKRTIHRRVALRGQPAGVAWAADGRHVFVSEFGAGTVAVVDSRKGEVTKRLAVGLHPEGLAVAGKRRLLLVANATTHCVSVVDLDAGRERKRIAVPREPHWIAVTPDESAAVVGNLLPAGPADPDAAAVVSVLDLERPSHAADIRLPPGSTAVRHVAIGRDGRRAYVVHVLARNNVPSTQLERGWVSTNALTILDLRTRTRYATVLLDSPVRGAADPWGVALDPKGKALWIALSGVHEVARVDLEGLEALLARKNHAAPANDLGALTRARLIERIPVAGIGPRGIALSPDGGLLATAAYFTGAIVFLDTKKGKAAGSVQLGKPVEPDQARLGERIFHDATECFQHWLSCATCHPNDGRVDGLNWDQAQDGIGNPKNNKSLLHAQHTPPMTWRGARPDVDASIRKGFAFLMQQSETRKVEAVGAYIRSLQPLPSPHLDGDRLTEAAQRGREIFASRRTRCARCHSGPYHTDLKMHDVGTRGDLDRAGEFDTPSLVEVFRTAPYLHDGSAATLREVLVERNEGDRHGRTSHLTPRQVDDLVAYLLSL